MLIALNVGDLKARDEGIRTTKIVDFPAPDHSRHYDPFNPFCQRR